MILQTVTKVRRNTHLFPCAIGTIAILLLLGRSLLAQEINDNGAGHSDQSESVMSIWSSESFETMIRLDVEAAAEFEHVGSLSEASRSLRSAANLQLSLDPSRSIVLARHALALSVRDQSLEGRSLSLGLLSLACLKSGQTGIGESYARISLALAKKIGAPNLLGRALLVSAEASYERQDFRSMLNFQKMALRHFRSTSQVEDDAECLQALAFSYVINNNPTLGLEAAYEAERLADSVGAKRIQVFSLIVLGEGLSRIGEWGKAIVSFRRAEALFPENIDLFERSILLNRIGKYYITFGDLRSAREYLERSLELFQKLKIDSAVSEISTVLGSICIDLRDERSAESYYSSALHLAKNQRLPTAVGLINEKIGQMHAQKGEYLLAMRHFRTSLTTFRKTGIQHSIVRVMTAMGITEFQKGNLHEAEGLLRKAVDLGRGISNVESVEESLFFLAQIDEQKGNLDAALAESGEALTLNESIQEQPTIPKLQVSYRSTNFDRYDLNMRLLMESARRHSDDRFAVEALKVAERSRARSFEESLSIKNESSAGEDDSEFKTQEAQLRERLNSKSDELTELLFQRADLVIIDAASKEINDIENNLEELRAKANNDRPFLEPAGSMPFDLAIFQQDILDDNDVFLEYSLGRNESYVWLIEKDQVSYYILPEQSVIEAKVSTVLDLLKAREPRPGDTPEIYASRVAEAEKNYPQFAAALSLDLFGPLAEKIKGKRLTISPAGRIGFLPMDALPFPNSGSDLPLLITNEVEYAASASVAMLIKRNKANELRKIPQKDLLVFSDPVFSSTDPRLNGQHPDQIVVPSSVSASRAAESIQGLERLPASRTEATAISTILPDSTILDGFSANRANVLDRDLSDYRVLHFATHGVLNDDYPELSGVLLSLYNEDGVPSEGFLRQNDINSLHLSADLVVLSACNTGIGKEERGEGIVGLSSAFLRAGASSVVSTLWKVDDSATEKLIQDFYGRLVNDGLSPAAALRASQIQLMQDDRYHSPFYWAAFIAQGDARAPITFSERHRSSSGLIITLTLVVACLLGLGVRAKFTRH